MATLHRFPSLVQRILHLLHPVARHIGVYLAGNTTVGRTNYTGVAGTAGPGPSVSGPYWGGYAGILSDRSRLTLGNITVQDGTSNTIMFGEFLGGTSAPVRDFVHAWMSAGAMPTLYGLARGNVDGEQRSVRTEVAPG